MDRVCSGPYDHHSGRMKDREKMTKRILIDHPGKQAHKTRVEKVKTILNGKQIKDLKQDELTVLIELLASQLGLLDSEGKLNSN